MEKGKKGAVLAWIMLIILFGFLGLLIYVNHFMPKDNDVVEEEKKNAIMASDIVSKFNEHPSVVALNNAEQTTVSAIADNENTIIINYQKEDYIKNFSVTITNNVMTIMCDKIEAEREIAASLFGFLLDSANQHFGLEVNATSETYEQFIHYNKNITGLAYGQTDTNYSYSADVSKALTLYKPANTYTSFTLIDKNNTDYEIIMNDYKINKVRFEDNETINLNLSITNNKEENRSAKVTLQLYDISNNILKTIEKNILFSEENKTITTAIPIPEDVDFNTVGKYSLVIE